MRKYLALSTLPSAAVLALSMALGDDANANGFECKPPACYPENPNPGKPEPVKPQPQPPVNVINKPDIDVVNKPVFNVGGGNGGQGGSGGHGYGGAGGNGYGGNQQQQQQQQQSADQSNQQNVTFNNKVARPMGNVAGAYLVNNSDCGEGWSLFLSAPYLGVGGGNMKQSQICLSQKAATAVMNAGVVKGDDGLIATGVAALSEIHPEVAAAVEVAYTNLTKECSVQAGQISSVLLARRGAAQKDENGKVVGYEGMDCAKVMDAFNKRPKMVVPPAPVEAPKAEAKPAVTVNNHITVQQQPAASVRRAQSNAAKPTAQPKTPEPCKDFVVPNANICLPEAQGRKLGLEPVK